MSNLHKSKQYDHQLGGYRYQLTVLSRSAIVVQSKCLVAFLCCRDACWILLWVWGLLSWD